MGIMKDSSLPFGVGSAYRHGWRKLWKYFLELFLIFIVGALLSVPSSAGGWSGQDMSGIGMMGFLGMAYTFLVAGPVELGISFAFLKAARDERAEVKDIFAAFSNYWNAVLASLLVGALVIIGLFILIVPGIFIACKLAFTPYLVVDRKMEVTEAIRESWRMTNGHALTVFVIGLLAIPLSIAGLLVMGVGIIISVMWVSLALASLYHAVTLQEKAAAQPTGA